MSISSVKSLDFFFEFYIILMVCRDGGVVSTSCFGTTNATRSPTLLTKSIIDAEMAEWSNAHDSKSCYGQLYGGSNPSLCAKKRKGIFFLFFFCCC